MSSIHSLVAHSVDYAGLFPPASLSMHQTVLNFADYLASPARSMLGRIVIPASRFIEFEDCLDKLSFPLETDAETVWQVSALAPAADSSTQLNNLNSVMQQITDFNLRHSVVVGSSRASQPRRAIVDSIEIKTDSPGQVEATLDALQQELWKQGMQSLQVFLEIDCQTDPTASIKSLAKATRPNTFAKIRTGGVTPEQIPSLELVARFIECCSSHGVGFKATAGLHHPLRGEYRLTYEQNPPRGSMHGFLNVFVATLMAFEHHLDRQAIQEILAERDFSQFHFDEDRLEWRNLSIAANRILELRNNSIQSFGSCSFDEPTLELQTHLENSGKQ